MMVHFDFLIVCILHHEFQLNICFNLGFPWTVRSKGGMCFVFVT